MLCAVCYEALHTVSNDIEEDEAKGIHCKVGTYGLYCGGETHWAVRVMFYWQFAADAASVLLRMWADPVCIRYQHQKRTFSRPIVTLNPNLWGRNELANLFAPTSWKSLLRNPLDDSKAYFNLHHGQCGEHTWLLHRKKSVSLFRPYFSTAALYLVSWQLGAARALTIFCGMCVNPKCPSTTLLEILFLLLPLWMRVNHSLMKSLTENSVCCR